MREAVAAGIVNVIHLLGSENPADVLTKFLPHRIAYRLMKEVLFWASYHPILDQGEGGVKTEEDGEDKNVSK